MRIRIAAPGLLTIGMGTAQATPTLTTLFSFNGTALYAGLIADANGNLFGTTSAGGASNKGTVFSISEAATSPPLPPL